MRAHIYICIHVYTHPYLNVHATLSVPAMVDKLDLKYATALAERTNRREACECTFRAHKHTKKPSLPMCRRERRHVIEEHNTLPSGLSSCDPAAAILRHVQFATCLAQAALYVMW